MDEKRIARNRELAETWFEAYAKAVDIGRVDGWTADDWADDAVIFSTWLGDVTAPKSAMSGEFDGGTYEMKAYWTKIPDLRALELKHLFPTEKGCAFLVRYGGHTEDGEYIEVNDAYYIYTNEEGKITRYEWYNDWLGFPKAKKLVTGLDPEEMTLEKNLMGYARANGDDPSAVKTLLEGMKSNTSA